jgi:hypothetical protein
VLPGKVTVPAIFIGHGITTDPIPACAFTAACNAAVLSLVPHTAPYARTSADVDDGAVKAHAPLRNKLALFGGVGTSPCAVAVHPFSSAVACIGVIAAGAAVIDPALPTNDWAEIDERSPSASACVPPSEILWPAIVTLAGSPTPSIVPLVPLHCGTYPFVDDPGPLTLPEPDGVAH